MKRIFKSSTSEIITKNLQYNSQGNNKKLGELLLKEQKGFCAYTEHYIGFEDANDIEHFNPDLKGTTNDNYYNWYKVKHLPNQRKLKGWIEPILMPYDVNFEDRVIYSDGEFFAKPADDAAKNLIILLDLNNQKKVEDRKNYIKRRKEAINDRKFSTNNEIINYFQDKVNNEIKSISYLRAIQEEFKIDIWNMIPQP